MNSTIQKSKVSLLYQDGCNGYWYPLPNRRSGLRIIRKGRSRQQPLSTCRRIDLEHISPIPNNLLERETFPDPNLTRCSLDTADEPNTQEPSIGHIPESISAVAYFDFPFLRVRVFPGPEPDVAPAINNGERTAGGEGQLADVSSFEVFQLQEI